MSGVGLRRLLRPLELARLDTQLLKQPCPAPAALFDGPTGEFGCGDNESACGAFESTADFTRHGSASSSDCGEEACISPALSTASSFWEDEDADGTAWSQESQPPAATDGCRDEPAAGAAQQQAAAEPSCSPCPDAALPAPVQPMSQPPPSAARTSACEAAADLLLAQLAPLSLRRSSSPRSAAAAPVQQAFWSPSAPNDGGSSPRAHAGARVCQLQRGLVQQQQAAAVLAPAVRWEEGGQAEEEAPPEWLARDMAALVGVVVCGALWQDDSEDEEDSDDA
ncbi:hypothetical protein HXX76_014560 [Chlamydomonas incerta]|uniref:Uncharacterized protein n=1 Tax=Chlamydomonas incerta TaxID=51695 RepID=A0A835SF22_CHLIN|nr:hypothetical protein HXX76_014560 [Chlamydomonas incerta]|eukprot:KAG2424351.1 hypothetical protein HXX76_014560 [Chlamydomonas incerta]